MRATGCARAVALVAGAIVAGGAVAAPVGVQRVTGPGGIEAWLVEDRLAPIVTMSFAFDGGTATDPAGKAGRAHMVAALLDQGAGTLDSQAFQRRLADNAIALGFEARLEGFWGSLRTLNRNRDEAFELLRLALTAPRFEARALARIRAQIKAGLANRQRDPRYLAGRALWRAAFPDHPYGRPGRGTPATIDAVTVADLRDFMRRGIGRDGLRIGVVGDIDAAALAPLLDRTFGALPRAAAPVDIADVAPALDGRTIVIDHPAPQSVVAFGQPGLKRDDPDFYAAHLLNHVLGGGSFSSRLYAEVREKRGLAYSVYSYLAPLDRSALWLGGVATANDAVATSLAVIREQWRRARAAGITADELAAAKQNVTGSFALRFINSGAIARFLVAMQRAALGIDYMARRNALFEAVTLADANRVAARLDPAKLTAVIVGRPAGIASDPGG